MKRIIALVLFAFLATIAFASVTCQIDKGPMIQTGQFKVGPTGALVYEWRCGNGHSVWL